MSIQVLFPESDHQLRRNDVGQFANHVELLFRFSTLMGVRTWTRAYRECACGGVTINHMA